MSETSSDAGVTARVPKRHDVILRPQQKLELKLPLSGPRKEWPDFETNQRVKGFEIPPSVMLPRDCMVASL